MNKYRKSKEIISIDNVIQIFIHMNMNIINLQNTPKKKHAWKNKAIFLDRDWTINQDFSYVYKIEDLKLLNWVKEWLSKLKKLWYKLIIISNQSWIWRWYYTMEDCKKFNNELEKQIWIKFDDIYICPHTAEDYCECRKPKTLLIEKAIKKFNLDIHKCFFVWDKASDIQTWINAWCKTVLINDSQYDCNLIPDYRINSLYELSEIIK